MSGETPDPQSFFRERLPEQWNRALSQQEQLVAAAQKVLDGMRAVEATLRVIVDGEPFDLNVTQGIMGKTGAAKQPPVLTLVLDRRAFARVVREAGDSAMGFLGGLSGLAGEMKLTKSRLDNLKGLKGALRFEVVGDDGFVLLTHFGADAIPEQPDTTLSVDPDTYEELRAGKLDPQAAFMGGKIRIAGDMQLAMQLALAALSPD
jgi:putative sterol carrier protein